MKLSLMQRCLGPSLAAAVLLAGCATPMNETPEQAVQRRATEYWQARIAGDYEKAYALSNPAYRQLRTLEQYRQQFGPAVSIRGAEVVKVSCKGDKCVANMKMMAKPALPGLNLGTIPMHIDETWLLQDGQWWYFQEP